jgi:hypothetical protein
VLRPNLRSWGKYGGEIWPLKRVDRVPEAAAIKYLQTLFILKELFSAILKSELVLSSAFVLSVYNLESFSAL